ncbi:hypothetical protein DID74_00505 [Candidatus Marinamargulisbacteria bacterium SCGC AG-333-B06]|nr:hypothetical protein DID74_00505 [Candidatus Marinamargulisbacteria bacterium SCGC AG-333-B06]
MIEKPTIIIFDPDLLCIDYPLIINSSYNVIRCFSHADLFSSLEYYERSIRVIIYCSQFTMSDYILIQSIKKTYFFPEFILLSYSYAIDIFTEIAKLGIFSIHNISIHSAIIELDITDILSETLSQAEVLAKRLNHVLDLDLYITYKRLLESPSHHTLSRKAGSKPPTINLTKINLDIYPFILIIDDNKPLNLKLSCFLTKHMMSSRSAFSADEALSLCNVYSFDLIILDLGLPDGYDHHLLHRLRCLYTKIPIILLTSCKDYESLLNCMKEGAFEYITKPFNQNILLHKIRHTLYFSQVRSLAFSDLIQ